MLKIAFEEEYIGINKEFVVSRIVVNGIRDNDSTYEEHSSFIDADDDDTITRHLDVYNRKVIDILLSATYKELSEHFDAIAFNDKKIFSELFDCRHIIWPEAKRGDSQIKHNVSINTDDWSKPWSMRQFVNEFRKQFRERYPQYYSEKGDKQYEHNSSDTFWILLAAESEQPMDDVILGNTILADLIETTTSALYKSLNEEALVTFFNFPTEIAAASKQYLVYFAQFLADMGIEADTEITNDANKTLFKVIPKDKNESLQKIKEALDQYLAAPAVKDFNATSTSQDVATLQWQANIDHLRSQVTLGKAIIAAKDAQINYLTKELEITYNNQIMIQLPESKSQTGEDIVGGLITVTQVEAPGFTLNLGEFVRKLKRKFL
jgi:hypothetical protein